MNKIASAFRRYELWYLVGAMATALLLYTGLKWYQAQSAPINAPQPRAALIQQANKYYQHANDLYRQANHGQALSYYKQAIEACPQHAQAHTMISVLTMQNGDISLAVDHAQKAVAANSRYIPAYLALGQCYAQLNRRDDAKITYQSALKVDPNNFESHLVLSQLLTQQMTPESCAQAIEHAKQALAIQPQNPEAQFALGDAHLTAGRPHDARMQYEKINDPKQEYRKALYIGQTHQRELDFDQAVNYYQQSIGYNSSFAQAHVALAGAYFALGQLGRGFKEYEWRWQLSNMKDLQNKWAGEPLQDKKIVVLGENGIGDIFQYVRFAQLVKNQGARVCVVANKPLVPLLQLCPYIDEIVPTGQQVSDFDYITSMQSIPAVMNINEHNLPTQPYLFANENLVAEWKQKFSGDTHFKIGLCWQPGDDTYLGVDQKRGLSLEHLAPLAQDGVSFYCLQIGGDTKEQLKTAPFKINSFDETFDKDHGSFMDTAAVMKNMDLIITVDTSVGHLAGALGVPTYMLLSYSADIRWMANTTKSIWYPSFEIFRQQKMGDWQTVVNEVKEVMAKRFQQNT